ncbi:hypothetical protein D1BOALGB6SA_1770 [Olavius sp. associated proteobacterium Delta 1]|nr:hypothetical protein D1BOALGB6SA_1770 [Olavius sp. associated proteobacterium Delta 1]
MLLLILGMVIFIAVHLIPTFVDLRQKLIAWKGEAFYKGGYSCAAFVGLILIIIGKGRAAHVPLWDPPGWAYHVTQFTMLIALILLPAAYMPTNLKRFMRHPFLTGLALWALSHMAVNGDLASLVLFGGLGVFALFDIWSSNRRGAEIAGGKFPIYRDIVVVVIGVMGYSVILYLHPYLFGASAIP